MLDGVAVGGSDEAFAAIAEGCARNYCDALGVKELFAELFARKARVTDTRINIECAVRLKAFKT